MSPKGLATFAILDPLCVAYQDFSGSGAEKIAHVRENGRITVMFRAFEGRPLIVRVYGKGHIVERGTEEFTELSSRFSPKPGVRTIIRVDVTRI